MVEARFLLYSLTDTEQFALTLLSHFDTPLILALTGELGSGKTAFVQTLAHKIGLTEPIPSPTFTLVNEYRAAKKDIILIHSDLYRLEQPEDITQLGLTDYFTSPNTIIAVEWADRARQLFPPQTIWIHFESTPHQRVATLKMESAERWPKLPLGGI